MRNNIEEILQKGETEKVELKQNFSNSVVISVNAFANTKGGKILIGVKDNKSITGVEINNETIQNWIHPIR